MELHSRCSEALADADFLHGLVLLDVPPRLADEEGEEAAAVAQDVVVEVDGAHLLALREVTAAHDVSHPNHVRLREYDEQYHPVDGSYSQENEGFHLCDISYLQRAEGSSSRVHSIDVTHL